ncbi:hypothetical protein ACFZAD_30930 [Streptomyces iakyrus]|uniref:hypothetical protein n=1 Tax=Streptomyces iakyrus TaxID=68219 RepID=UPI0036E03B00
MNKRIKKAAGAIIGGLFLLGASPAYAISASTDGAAAWTDNCNRTKCGVDYVFVWVKDRKADGHPVKAEYEKKLTGDVDVLWEKRGNGNENVSKDIELGVAAIKACEYINNWPDDCSGWSRS